MSCTGLVVIFGADIAKARDRIEESPGNAGSTIGGGLIEGSTDALARTSHCTTTITDTMTTTYLQEKEEGYGEDIMSTSSGSQTRTMEGGITLTA